MSRRFFGGYGFRFAVVMLALGSWSCGGSKSTTPAGGGSTLELNSGNMGNNVTYAHRFMTAGVFPYHCIFHSNMTGIVTVNGLGTASDTTITIAASVPFPAVTFQVGHTITWRNTSGTIHTVTSN